jgi:hypothetical protein
MLLRVGSRHMTAAELEHRLRVAGWQSDPSGIHRATAMLTTRGLLHTLPSPGPTAYGLALHR